MPVIPTYTAQISARTGQPAGQMLQVRATPGAFGADIGAGLVRAGAGIGDVAEGLDVYAERKRKEKVANTVAQSDFTRKELEVRNEVGPDGAQLQERTLNAFDEFVNEKANAIDDPVARTQYLRKMQEERLRVSSRSVTQEFALDAAHSKAEAETSLATLENKIINNPYSYDQYISEGFAVIDTRTDMPAHLRETMKQVWRENSANARFTGALERAKTVDDVDAIAAELASPQAASRDRQEKARDWAKELKPSDYEKLLNSIGTTRKAIVTKADTDARAAIDTIEERAKGLSLIPEDELRAVSSVVKQSQNPITAARMARIVRDQSIIKDARKLPPVDQRTIINGVKGDPTTAHPGVPARVSTAINKATTKFGVSGSYLAITAQREYGQYFKRQTRQTDAKYAIKPAHNGVDLRNVRPDVVEAANVAGELFGAPLTATSAYRSQERQDAIRAKGDPNRASVAKHSYHTDASALDISTAGMSDADKARAVAALADAGFTGFGEYDGHIHADFREAVPQSFGDRDGKTWGGWTWLSPAVAASLKERGFAAGAKGDAIKRAKPVQYAEDIDYGRGTSVLDDNGNPASSAVGVMQMTSRTWLELMRDPSVTTRIGIDTSNMSEKQLLDLRSNPDVSIMAGAALGEKNKKTMEAALGRTVDDAELYMAHFFGAGGAIALMQAREKQPGQAASEVLPEAAKSHGNVFKRGGKDLSVEEVYQTISRNFVASPTRVSYDDVQTRERVLKETEQRLTDNPMGLAREIGTHDVPDLTADNMQAYGAAVRSVAEYYNIPVSDMKVLEPDAVNALKRQMDNGDADAALSVLTSMQAMGTDVARAALKQLGEKDNVYAYAGALGLEGHSAEAGDVVRGQKRLQENPALRDELGLDAATLAQEFRTVTGNALNEASPKVRQDIQDAALAHYAETVLGRGKSIAFDREGYARSVQAVLGGDGSVGEVNGEPTVLPRGLDADTVESALRNMTVADWADLSLRGTPPRYADGTIADPRDIEDEAKLRAVGAGQYRVQLDDGTFLVTGSMTATGRLETFIFTPDPERVNELAKAANSGEAAPEFEAMP